MRRARWAAWLCMGLIAALAWSVAPSRAQSDPPTVKEYWQQMDEALKAIRKARDLPPPERAPALAQIADALEPITSVTLPDGQSALVDNADLIAALRADEPDVDHIETRLAALEYTRRIWPHGAARTDAFDKLAAVLARPEFQPVVKQTPTWLQEWLEKFNRWLNRMLARLMFSDEAHVLGVDWVVLALGAVVLSGVAYFFWRNVRAHLVREAALARDAAESGGLSAARATQQARRLAAQSDYRQAMRYLYLAALLALDERGVLRYDKALTNREVLHRAGQSADSNLAQIMSPVVETFDQVWYGFAPVDDETFRKYHEQIERVVDSKG